MSNPHKELGELKSLLTNVRLVHRKYCDKFRKFNTDGTINCNKKCKIFNNCNDFDGCLDMLLSYVKD